MMFRHSSFLEIWPLAMPTRTVLDILVTLQIAEMMFWDDTVHVGGQTLFKYREDPPL